MLSKNAKQNGSLYSNKIKQKNFKIHDELSTNPFLMCESAVQEKFKIQGET